MDKDRVYIEKRKFVEKVNEALIRLPDLEAIEYRNISDKYSEFLRVTYGCGEQIYIDVTGDSIEAMAQEMAKAILREHSTAEVTQPAHVAIVEGWFEAAR